MPNKAIDTSKVKLYSIKERLNKVKIDDFAWVYEKDSSFMSFLDKLPNILKASELIEFVDKIIEARRNNKPVILGMGAHPIKCGLSPLIIKLIKDKIITDIAFNGACIIHDTEIALIGETSEDVAEGLEDGTFGMIKETGDFIHEVMKKRNGIGYPLGKAILDNNLEYSEYSILASAYKYNASVTVHVAIGTDIIHQHPKADGADIGYNSMHDFKVFSRNLIDMNDGGVFLNLGSHVIIPEVFLKALTVARNLGHDVKKFYTANMDMNQHYRPTFNILQRPTKSSGKSYSFIGHHEIMFPLLFSAIMEKWYD